MTKGIYAKTKNDINRANKLGLAHADSVAQDDVKRVYG